MIDGDIRALQIKMLAEDQLRALHRKEDELGAPLTMQDIAAVFKQEPIKTYYRVTSNSRSGRATSKVLREWGARIRGAVARFARESGQHFGGDLAQIHAYDQAVWASDLDFYYKTATATKKATGWWGQGT